jgi:hypothetical protein
VNAGLRFAMGYGDVEEEATASSQMGPKQSNHRSTRFHLSHCKNTSQTRKTFGINYLQCSTPFNNGKFNFDYPNKPYQRYEGIYIMIRIVVMLTMSNILPLHDLAVVVG